MHISYNIVDLFRSIPIPSSMVSQEDNLHQRYTHHPHIVLDPQRKSFCHNTMAFRLGSQLGCRIHERHHNTGDLSRNIQMVNNKDR